MKPGVTSKARLPKDRAVRKKKEEGLSDEFQKLWGEKSRKKERKGDLKLRRVSKINGGCRTEANNRCSIEGLRKNQRDWEKRG